MKRTFLTLIAILLPLFGSHALAQEGFVYEDPAGQFTVPLGADWRVIELNNSYGQFQLANSSAVVTLLSLPIGDEVQNSDQGARAALAQIGVEVTEILASAGQGTWDLYIYDTRTAEPAAAAALNNEQAVVVLLLTGDASVVSSPPLPVMALLSQIVVTDQDPVELPATVEAFEAWVGSMADRDRVSISVAVSIGAQTIYSAGFGMRDDAQETPADGDTVYHWASSTKIVTATALMQLVDQGLVDLDAPISEYLEYFPAQFGITARHLLTHGSGLPEQPNVLRYVSTVAGDLLDPDPIAREYAPSLTALDFEPGTDVRYSNYGFLLLGEIVHQVSGLPYADYVRQNILAPLGMTRTDFIHTREMMANTAQASGIAEEVEALRSQLGDTLASALFLRVDENNVWFNPFNVLPAWGGLNGPPSEQIRFLNMHVNGGELDGVRILQPNTVAQMQESQVGTDVEGFGLAWRLTRLLGISAIGHAGGGPGMSMEMQYFPQHNIAITVMTNRTGYNASRIMEAALNVVLMQPRAG
jgi:CubicO group peptidase (beta-lactamase class C family)